MRFLCCLLFLLLTLPGFAQFRAKSIEFTGYPKASKVDLLSASGLKEGESLTDAQLQEAANKLSDTGMFSNVSFEYAGETLKVTLEPTKDLVPVLYQNFPFWTAEELTQLVHAKVPLYTGSIAPVKGMKAAVSNALKEILSEKLHIDAQVHGGLLTQGKSPLMGFTIELPRVTISAANIDGVSPSHEAAVKKIADSLVGDQYLEPYTSDRLKQALAAHYANNGFVDFSLQVVPNPNSNVQGQQIKTALTLKITEGLQYKVGSLVIDANPLITQEEFERHLAIHSGEMANLELLHKGLAYPSSMYQTKGYITAKLSVQTTRHADSKTVDYKISVTPGEVFHLGTVRFENLTPDQKAQVEKAWKLAPGDVYDPTYAPGFMRNNARSLQSLAGLTASYSQKVNTENHTVDVILSFQRAGAL